MSYTDFFRKLCSMKDIAEIDSLYEEYHILRKDKKAYPDIEFSITANEIDELKQKGFITEENIVSSDISKKELTAFEKLLYSILWKNGDLKKEKHIICGIYGIDADSKGIVFNQFGKYLENKDEPIIDQHVIRAFILYKTGRRIKDIKVEHYSEYFEQYVNWLNNNDLFKNNKSKIDDIMFCLGKKIKKY